MYNRRALRCLIATGTGILLLWPEAPHIHRAMELFSEPGVEGRCGESIGKRSMAAFWWEHGGSLLQASNRMCITYHALPHSYDPNGVVLVIFTVPSRLVIKTCAW